MIRLAWLETLLPMTGEIQAELNCHTAGVSDAHAGTYASLLFARQPSYVPLSGGSEIP